MHNHRLSIAVTIICWQLLSMTAMGTTNIGSNSSSSLSFNLIICLYNEPNKKRADEYRHCLQKNLRNAAIQNIHVIYDTSKDPDKQSSLHEWLLSQKITLSYTEKRQSFGDCFRCANELIPEETVIISNADIWFNKTLSLIKSNHLEGKFFAITRHDRKENRLKRVQLSFSHDSWIFKTPFKTSGKLNHVPIGSWFCEKPVVDAAQKLAGLRVYNPALSIQCIHEHQSGIRHYMKPAFGTEKGRVPITSLAKIRCLSADMLDDVPLCTLDEILKLDAELA